MQSEADTPKEYIIGYQLNTQTDIGLKRILNEEDTAISL